METLLKEGAILESKKLPLSELLPNNGQIPDVPKNPRFIRDERFEKLKKSIVDDPEMLSVNELKVYPYKGKYIIIGGNMRYQALKKLGRKEAVCKIIPESATAKQLRAYIQKDNIAFGEFDLDDLANEWDANELRSWGLDLPEIEEAKQEEEAEEDNYDVEDNIPDEPKAKLGDVYLLGEHRLVCGDCLDTRTFGALFPKEEMASVLLTDPPYGISYESKNKNIAGRKIENDSLEEAALETFLEKSFALSNEHVKVGGAFYIWHADGKELAFRKAIAATTFEVKQCLIWVKNNFTIGRQDYQWMHESCLYGWKKGASHYFTESRTQKTVYEEQLPDIEKMTKDEMQKLLKSIYDLPKTIIKEDKPLHSDLHPTMKPLKLMGLLIRNSSRHGEIILDTFGGSGSTLMAAEQLGRRCYMSELDPRYIDVIINRWEDFTGENAKKIGNFIQ